MPPQFNFTLSFYVCGQGGKKVYLAKLMNEAASHKKTAACGGRYNFYTNQSLLSIRTHTYISRLFRDVF